MSGGELKWFKVWTKITTDPDFLTLSFEDLGRWVYLGALVAQHGDKGVLDMPAQALSTYLKCSAKDMRKVVERLPNVVFREQKRDGRITVTFERWSKYQIDSTGLERQRRYRDKQKRNGLREDKIREDKSISDSDRYDDGKKPFLDYVFLTDSEYQLLLEHFGGETETHRYIKKLNDGIALKGYQYDSHYLAILKWHSNDMGGEPEEIAASKQKMDEIYRKAVGNADNK